MECICEPIDADDICNVWSITWQKARKEHSCCECQDVIAPGQRYQRIFAMFDGEITVYKTCEFCANEFKRIEDKWRDRCFVKGDLACMVVWDMRVELGLE